MRIADVVESLDHVIQRSMERSSRVGYFAALYRLVTVTIQSRLGTGYFDDDARMERLDVAFASRYLDALRAYEANDPTCQASWRVAFEACERPGVTVLQHLLAAINPHMNVDLGVACAQIAPGDAIGTLHGDFERINTLLAGLVPIVRDEVAEVSPLIHASVGLFGWEEREIAALGIVVGREVAWSFAKRMAAAPPEQHGALILERNAEVARIGHAILEPGVLSGITHFLSERDSQDVVFNIRALCKGQHLEGLDL